jgi:serine-protein kinase ATM
MLLDTMLTRKLVDVRDVADDINQIVTTADISGPAVLVDSSLIFMQSLLRLRNVMSPNASPATSSHIIRWVFVKWNPGESLSLARARAANC